MTAQTPTSQIPAHEAIAVEGMTCASCVARVEKAISRVAGVASVSVNLTTERADVSYAAAPVHEAVVQAIRRAGYDVAPVQYDLAIEGMTCASCVARVEKAIGAVPGVTGVTVNLATERATIKGLDQTAAMTAAIEAAVRRAGYEPRKVQAAEGRAAARQVEQDHLCRDFLIAASLTLPIFVVEMARHLIPAVHMGLTMTVGDTPLYMLYFLLATAVQFGPGLRFYVKGVPALARLSPDMNALVVLGSTAAWAYSVVATFVPNLLPQGTAQVYFEASSVIITLILMGRYLEAKAKGRTSEAISRLVGQQGQAQHMIEVRVAEQDVINQGQPRERQIADAGAGVDQDIVVEQERGGATAIGDRPGTAQDLDLHGSGRSASRHAGAPAKTQNPMVRPPCTHHKR